jgi:hypothetical protein
MKAALKAVLPLLCASLTLFLSGCLYSKSHPAGVEPSAKYMESVRYEVIGEGEGSASSFTLFSIIRVTPPLDSIEAVDEAVKSRGGDNLIEAVFTKEKRVYIIGTVDIIHVKGKVVRYLR